MGEFFGSYTGRFFVSNGSSWVLRVLACEYSWIFELSRTCPPKAESALCNLKGKNIVRDLSLNPSIWFDCIIFLSAYSNTYQGL